MSTSWFEAISPYGLRARLQPALFCLLPVPVVVVVLPVGVEVEWRVLAGVLAYCGGTTFLVELGRSVGKAREQALFRLWDGKPSVAMLRHRDTRIDGRTKERYRAFLASALSGTPFPSVEQERRCPSTADEVYEGATSWLLEQTRDSTRFHLLFSENKSYGFRRNLLGLKRVAVAMDLVLLGLLVSVSIENDGFSVSAVDPKFLLCVAITALHCLALVLFVRPSWVESAAVAYGKRLLAACDELARRA